ncbi:tannase and feruloyl esterase [Roridomyces roridus]|uniref:Carboxylic ester hydrolase n=1 Tax=Roridomyces roridus TaxID=1738132 RepID=A0AAD7BII1_9AGAR|nr:tannase and feruloyl esterase [Roridomyces roridus]
MHHPLSIALLSTPLLQLHGVSGQALDPARRCLSLLGTAHLENTTILQVDYIPEAMNVSTPGSCQSTAALTSAPLCRVQLVINTTSTSAVHAEAWLPDTWYGRFLGVGNGGLNGCIDYTALDYGASLHFATIGSDNGHDGSSGLPFLDHPEVINDFAFRAIHVEALIGKQLVSEYYGTSATKSYYLGCSTGGRQGTQEALKFPDDYDGIVAGSPATDWNNLMGWTGIIGHATGAVSANTTNTASPKFLSQADWNVVSAAILSACDTFDGLVDGIISEPDDCFFDEDALLCAANQTMGCLTRTQVESIKQVYSPILGFHGEVLYPRYSPGAEADPTHAAIIGGRYFSVVTDWEQYAILNVTEHDFSEFSLHDVALFNEINAGGIATFSGDLAAFRDRGGKFLTYHGRRDPLISSTNSKRVYDLISNTLNMPSLDSFYRLFLIPGMGHCGGGLGPTSFGQSSIASNLVNDTEHNILLALVDWVEGGAGRAPGTIIGAAVDGSMRVHCRYPMRSVWDGEEFICVV